MPFSPSRAAEPYPLERMFGRILSPFERFMRGATAGGIVLIAATAATLALANSPVGEAWSSFWNQPLRIAAFGSEIVHTLREWVNDALMALFFLLVGLELKREMLVGELASARDAALPVAAAAGGMIVPAVLYLLINPSAPSSSGWGVPMATDIAFAIGVLVMLGERVPRGLLVFLMALAIADDLGAVVAIAIAYTQGVDVGALASAAFVLTVLVMLNRGGVRDPAPYALLGIVLWYFTLLSGIHSTIAGVLLALAIPARPAVGPVELDGRVRELLAAFRRHADDPTTPSDALASNDMATIAAELERDAKRAQSPLHRAEHAIGPWVTYFVLPVFALANAAIDFGNVDVGETLASPIVRGIALGLVVGKFAGIAGASYAAVRLGLARLPSGVAWRHLLGVAWLGGIGFTMSLFIGQLAFGREHIEIAKIGILGGSFVAAVIGFCWIALVTRKT